MWYNTADLELSCRLSRYVEEDWKKRFPRPRPKHLRANSVQLCHIFSSKLWTSLEASEPHQRAVTGNTSLLFQQQCWFSGGLCEPVVLCGSPVLRESQREDSGGLVFMRVCDLVLSLGGYTGTASQKVCAWKQRKWSLVWWYSTECVALEAHLSAVVWRSGREARSALPTDHVYSLALNCSVICTQCTSRLPTPVLCMSGLFSPIVYNFTSRKPWGNCRKPHF